VYIILMVQILAMLDSSDLISNFHTISMFVSGNIQNATCRYVLDLYPYTILHA
jgi:hypothetical protein